LLEGKPHEQFLWGGAGNGPGHTTGAAPVPYPTTTLCLAAPFSLLGYPLEYRVENFFGMVRLGCMQILLRHLWGVYS
ncbi:MAG: hypothetical protein WCA27_21165, partial [Candidatus Sulfotelmatobacter sp.]